GTGHVPVACQTRNARAQRWAARSTVAAVCRWGSQRRRRRRRPWGAIQHSLHTPSARPSTCGQSRGRGTVVLGGGGAAGYAAGWVTARGTGRPAAGTVPCQHGAPVGSSVSRKRPGNRVRTASASQTMRRASLGRRGGGVIGNVLRGAGGYILE